MELPDGCRDELAQEAGVPVLHRADAFRSATGAWDASDAVRRDARWDAEVRHPALADADAEKLVVPAPGARELDALSLPPERQPARSEQPAWAAELCTRVSARFAARSCAATESAEQPAQSDARQPALAAQLSMQSQKMVLVRRALLAAQPFARAERFPPEALQEVQKLASRPAPHSQCVSEPPAMPRALKLEAPRLVTLLTHWAEPLASPLQAARSRAC
jgi:hypothetical protein